MRHPRLKPEGQDMFYHVDSKAFVVQIMTAARGAEHMGKRRLTAALEEGAGALRLMCYKRLRQFAT